MIDGAESLNIDIRSLNEECIAYTEAVVQPIHEANRTARNSEILWNAEMIPAESLGVKRPMG